MSDHEWVQRWYRGNPTKQRQCAKCGIYETEMSRDAGCPPYWRTAPRPGAGTEGQG